jgi:hypothetical protein
MVSEKFTVILKSLSVLRSICNLVPHAMVCGSGFGQRVEHPVGELRRGESLVVGEGLAMHVRISGLRLRNVKLA